MSPKEIYKFDQNCTYFYLFHWIFDRYATSCAGWIEGDGVGRGSQLCSLFILKIVLVLFYREESNRSTPSNSVESDLGCTSRIYFDNVTLTLHNVTLAT